jgi:hypothetical protein
MLPTHVPSGSHQLCRPSRADADYLTSLPFDGYCVGGSLGKNRDELVGAGPLLPPHTTVPPPRGSCAPLTIHPLVYCPATQQVQLLQFVMPQLPAEKPNHLLGIADEPSIDACVPLGVDTFDSCFPTRLGRHNTLLTREGRLNIKKRAFERDFRPLDEQCACHTCKTHTCVCVRLRRPCCVAHTPPGAALHSPPLVASPQTTAPPARLLAYATQLPGSHPRCARRV